MPLDLLWGVGAECPKLNGETKCADLQDSWSPGSLEVVDEESFFLVNSLHEHLAYVVITITGRLNSGPVSEMKGRIQLLKSWARYQTPGLEVTGVLGPNHQP